MRCAPLFVLRRVLWRVTIAHQIPTAAARLEGNLAVRFFSRAEFRELFTAAGFDVLEQDEYMYLNGVPQSQYIVAMKPPTHRSVLRAAPPPDPPLDTLVYTAVERKHLRLWRELRSKPATCTAEGRAKLAKQLAEERGRSKVDTKDISPWLVPCVEARKKRERKQASKLLLPQVAKSSIEAFMSLFTASRDHG